MLAVGAGDSAIYWCSPGLWSSLPGTCRQASQTPLRWSSPSHAGRRDLGGVEWSSLSDGYARGCSLPEALLVPDRPGFLLISSQVCQFLVSRRASADGTTAVSVPAGSIRPTAGAPEVPSLAALCPVRPLSERIGTPVDSTSTVLVVYYSKVILRMFTDVHPTWHRGWGFTVSPCIPHMRIPTEIEDLAINSFCQLAILAKVRLWRLWLWWLWLWRLRRMRLRRLRVSCRRIRKLKHAVMLEGSYAWCAHHRVEPGCQA